MDGTLAERKLKEAVREAEIAAVLAATDKKLEAAKRKKRRKKKSPDELLALLDIAGMSGRELRPSNTYVPASYNLDRQLVGLLNHLFVRYPVPAFMYAACIKPGPTDRRLPCRDDLHKEWFLTIAQGGSFTRAVKGIMTSREAHAFLHAPAANAIHTNVWWARLRVAGIGIATAGKLLERLFAGTEYLDSTGLLAEAIHFYARYHSEMDRNTFNEITDFLAWKLVYDRAFTLKGRTLSSVTKLCNEWHVETQKAKLGSLITWTGLAIAPWTWMRRDCIWEATELLSNHELIREGRKQQHCVSSYVTWCAQGRSTIVSMRQYSKAPSGFGEDGSVLWGKGDELSRVTIEIASDRRIVQMKARLNAPPNKDQTEAIRHWQG